MSISVSVIMGSKSDWPVMKEACLILEELGVAYEKKIVSAHRLLTGCLNLQKLPLNGESR